MTIRFAGKEDAQTVSSMLKALGEDIAKLTGAVINTDTALIEKLYDEHLGQKFRAIIIEADGEAVGFSTFYESFALYAGGSYMTVTELFVEAEHRSKGYGAKAIEWLKAYGKEKNYTRVELTTPPLPQFQRSLDFYLQNGFETTGGRKVKCEL